jgi:hypothetical protein
MHLFSICDNVLYHIYGATMSNTFNPVKAAAKAARRVRETLETAAKHIKASGHDAASGELKKAVDAAVGPLIDDAYAEGLGKVGTSHPDATARSAAAEAVADAVNTGGWSIPSTEDDGWWKEVERRMADAIKPHIEDAHTRGRADAARDAKTRN